jgi:hypothetical protein
MHSLWQVLLSFPFKHVVCDKFVSVFPVNIFYVISLSFPIDLLKPSSNFTYNQV